MKPQTGILISVHSYSKQYIQFFFRVKVYYRFTRGGSLWRKPQTYSNICTLQFSRSPLLAEACLLPWHQGIEGLSRQRRGNSIYRRQWSVLGGFFSRAVDPGIGKLLIQCGIHVGLSFF